MMCTVTEVSSNKLFISITGFIKVAFSQHVSTNILLMIISEFSEVIGAFSLLFPPQATVETNLKVIHGNISFSLCVIQNSPSLYSLPHSYFYLFR